MAISIKATELALQKIFSNDFSFEIPSFQRPYAWTTEQASELLLDLLDASKDQITPLADTPPYFLGSVVLIKGDDPRADVVDGQQRLTTLTLLLAALRERVDPPMSDDVTAFLYQKENSLTGAPAAYRLKIRPKDQDFFQQYVQDEGGLAKLDGLAGVLLSDSQRLLRDNALLYREELSKLDLKRCERLLTYLINRCFLVTVSTPNFDSAYRIFSVMNSRGLQLSVTDLLKSEIIGELAPTDREIYTQKWEGIEEEIGREQFAELFAHIRMIARRVKAQDTVLKEIQSHVQPTKDPKKFVDGALQPYAQAYSQILFRNYTSTSDATEINELFGWLLQIDNFDWIPPAILFLSSHDTDPKALKRFFTDLERLATTLMLRRANVNTRLTRYGKLLEEIETGVDLFRSDSALQLQAVEKTEARQALDGELYGQPFARYVLLRLDRALAGAGAIYAHAAISIEHVLPQNPPSGSQWQKWFTATQQEEWVHRLSNLVLLERRKNASAQNYEFDKKKRGYFGGKGGVSPFQLTTQILTQSTWKPSDVQARQTQLLKDLITLWRL